MSTTHRVSGSIVKRGQKIYNERLRSILEPEQNGKYVVIDVDTGEYEVDEDHMAASDRAHKNKPGKVLFATKIGFAALGRLRTPVMVRKHD